MEEMDEYAGLRNDANRREVLERIGRLVPEDGQAIPVPGVRLFRASATTERVYGVSTPAFCVIAQGVKEVYLGGSRYRYDPNHYLLATVELPVTGRVAEACPERPYLAMRVDLDPALVGSAIVEAGLVAPEVAGDAKALGVSALDSGLLDAASRLVRLLESPEEARALLPLVRQEIVFRLLAGEQGHRLRHLAAPGGHPQRIAGALERLRREFDRPLRIESLAREMGMSSTRFHHHFKAVTDMSPLQFQKRLRLQEARRLMLGEELDAASAGYRVGYDDASHFSRDYKRHFGQAPMRDVERLRSMVAVD